MQNKICTLVVLLIITSVAVQAQDAKADLNDQLWEAARKGDAAEVKNLLAKGVDVNAKFRYGATALSYACDKGHLEVVKVLLENGADVNVRDTFYQATPMSWALSKGHTAIVAALLAKGAEGPDQVLIAGARRGNKEMVGVALAKGDLKPESLTAALVSASTNDRTEMVEMLKEAGAKPPPEIDSAILQTYIGKYKSEQGTEVSISLQDSRLIATVTGQNPIPLMSVDTTTFKPIEFDGIVIGFKVENEKVTGFDLRQGPGTTLFKRFD